MFETIASLLLSTAMIVFGLRIMVKRRFVAGSQYFSARPPAISGRHAVVLGVIYFIAGIIAFSGTVVNAYFDFFPTWNVLPILFVIAFIATLWFIYCKIIGVVE
ncbi:MAG: hypothetical protein AAGK74_01925 [Chloroflexota bacterium]